MLHMRQSLYLSSRLRRGLVVALAAASLVACGSDDDDDGDAAAPPAGGTASTLSCETKQFAAGTVATVPTAAQIAPFAKTYTSGTNTVVLAPNGDLSVNGKAITVASTCLVKEPAGDMLMLSWGNANTVGAGAIVYDSHIDFRSSGISGIADGVIL
jgi:hypothetical protein